MRKKNIELKLKITIYLIVPMAANVVLAEMGLCIVPMDVSCSFHFLALSILKLRFLEKIASNTFSY